MKTLLTNLIAIVLIATPTAISAQNVVRTQQKEHANITLFTNTNDISISSHAGITFQWWYTSDSHSSNTADLINIDDYATSLNDFVHLFPKIKISNSVGNITQN